MANECERGGRATENAGGSILVFSEAYVLPGIFYFKNILRTSAVSSMNFRSILIFASCVVDTGNILNG